MLIDVDRLRTVVQRPPSVTEVVQELAGFLVAFVIGLGMLLVWPDRAAAPQWAVLATGGVIAVAASVLIGWFLFRRRQLMGLRWSPRPWRYTVPMLFGWLIATVWLSIERETNPDWALAVYLFSLPVLALSVFVSDLWWVTRSRGDPTEVSPS